MSGLSDWVKDHKNAVVVVGVALGAFVVGGFVFGCPLCKAWFGKCCDTHKCCKKNECEKRADK